jgi:hypothetical protein
LTATPAPLSSLVEVLLFFSIFIVVEVVVVIAVLVVVLIFLVVIVVVEVVIPVGKFQVAILTKDELATAFRAAQGFALIEVVRVDLFEIAVRASRHIARSSIESATSRRTLDYSEIGAARATNPNAFGPPCR